MRSPNSSQAYAKYQHDADEFRAEFEDELAHFVGRPSPIYHAKRLSAQELGGAQIYLKREDLNHTGAHKVNNTIGQVLLASAAWASRASLPRPAPASMAWPPPRSARATAWNAWSTWARRTSSASRPTSTACSCWAPPWCRWRAAARRLKDALNEAMRDWVTNVESTFYIIGTVAGPHPYPMLVRDFQRVIGDECLTQMPVDGRPPAGCGDCLRRRRQQCDGHLLPLSWSFEKRAPDRR